MAFASIYIPNFMLQAALFAEPDCRAHAVALLDGVPPLRNVVAVNDSAQRAGVKEGMTESRATQFCEVKIIYRSHSCEELLHSTLLQIAWSISPRIEDTAADNIVVDLAGLNDIFGSNQNIADELTRRVSEIGLLAQVAIAANIEAALHASRGFPGIIIIPPGQESTVLGRLPVRVLYPSAEIQETLERWGVTTCAELAALPILQLSERLGQEGVRLHEFALGTSARSLRRLANSTMRFEEQIELEDAVEELEPLSFLLGRLLDQLCARLQAHTLAVCAIQLRFTLGDAFQPPPQERRAAFVAEASRAVYEKTLRLPVPMRDSKLLLNLLRLQLQADPPPASVLAISLIAEPAQRRSLQGDLFQRASIDPEKLELILAKLSNLAGGSNVGSPEILDTHRPGAFRMNRFAFAPNAEKQRRNGTAKTANLQIEPARARRNSILAFRNFRPKWLVKIEAREGRPVHIYFRGMRGRIVAASGPWRTSGDWWREEAWSHDEWDVQICFDSNAAFMNRNSHFGPPDGLFRIYYDDLRHNWFVSGRYD